MDLSAASLVSSAESNVSAESGRGAAVRQSASDLSGKPLPLDLSHLFSETTNMRKPSRMKQYYKFFQIPGAGNLAGGLPHVSYFPYDTLEAQIAQPDRWLPSPQAVVLADGTNTDDEDDDAVLITGKMAAAKLASSVSSTRAAQSAASLASPPDRLAPLRLQVPKSVPPGAPDRKIDLATALQYGGSDGYPPLLTWVRSFVRDHVHPNVPYQGGPEVVMTVGATDGLSKTLDLFVDRWNPKHDVRERPGLLVEPFIYGNALGQAAAYGMQPVVVEADAGGMLAYGPGGLEDVLSNWDPSRGRRPHLLYNVTLGHNPTGIILSIERRRELYAVCSRFDVIIIEDDPYWHLQYPSAAEAEAVSRNLPSPKAAPLSPPISANQKSSGYDFLDSLAPSFLSIDVDGRVVRLDTFSKTVAPGCRVGWITAQPDFVEKITRITEGTTSQPSGFVQSLLSELVRGPAPPAAATAASSDSKSAKCLNRVSPSSSAIRSSPSDSSFTGWQTDGWVRWLEGLRGEYERRMTQMCTILDEGSFQLKQGTPVRPSDSDWGVITKTQLYSFDWPRAGMFVWIRAHFEAHPLWQAPRSSGGDGDGNGDGNVLDGPALQMALLLLLTSKPHLVIISPGDMFSATDGVHKARGWMYFRLCFAAESDENLIASTQRLVAGIQKFWKIKKVKEIEDLLDASPFSAEDAAAATNLGGISLGC